MHDAYLGRVPVLDSDHAALLGGALEVRLSVIRFPLSEPTEREIYHLVSAYVAELKALGFPPERVIIAVKRAANEAGLYSTVRVTGISHDLNDADKLLVDMVRWCIERYYGRPRRD